MSQQRSRADRRQRRHRRIRKNMVGTPERPRLAVFRSHRHLYVQVIDDLAGRTLFGCSTLDERLRGLRATGTVPAAEALGKLVASEASQRGVARVMFDRGGYRYHGRIKAVGEAVRAGGIQV